MASTGESNCDNDRTDSKPKGVPPRDTRATTPEDGKNAAHESEKINSYRERFVYAPGKSAVRWTDAHGGAISAIATVVIAIATIVNVFYVGGQLSEMKSSGIQTDKLISTNANLAEAAKDQAAAAVVQARAAQLMAEATRDIQIDSRLTITTFLQSQMPNVKSFGPDQTASFMMFINNNGFAPANQYRAWAKAEVHELPLNSPITTIIPQVAPTSLAKDGMSPELDAVTSVPISKSDFDAIQRGEKAIYIFGEATYIDPYGSPGDYPIRYIYGKNALGPAPGFTAGDFRVIESKD